MRLSSSMTRILFMPNLPFRGCGFECSGAFGALRLWRAAVRRRVVLRNGHFGNWRHLFASWLLRLWRAAVRRQVVLRNGRFGNSRHLFAWWPLRLRRAAVRTGRERLRDGMQKQFGFVRFFEETGCAK